MYEYKCKIMRVVDGDTVDVDIDLGFGIVMADERVRVMGIDTPESRTSDPVEKLFGKAAKARLEELLGETSVLRTQINKNGEDMKGKFGRVLGDFVANDGRLITEILTEEGHCVPYTGGSKEETLAAHLENRVRIIAEGLVTQEQINEVEQHVKEQINKAVLKHAEGVQELAKTNILVYMHNPVGIGEHSDVVEAIQLELDKMAASQDRIDMMKLVMENT